MKNPYDIRLHDSINETILDVNPHLVYDKRTFSKPLHAKKLQTNKILYLSITLIKNEGKLISAVKV